jgi:ABC-2 type transport system permease protein
MRWTEFRNGLRSFKGAAELGAHIFVILLFSILGLGVASGLAVAAYSMALHGKWQFIPALFWGVFFLWQIVPITVASFQQQFEFGALLRFPVSFGAFFLLSFLSGLVDVSTLLGGLCSAGILMGITAARPSLFVLAALVLIAFGIFNVLLSRMVFAWIERWLAQRRTREIATAVFLCLILAVNFFNPAFRKAAGTTGDLSPHARAATMQYLHKANAVQRWLPPGVAAGALRSGAQSNAVVATLCFGTLGVYIVLCGAALGVRLRAAFRGEDLGEAPSSRKVERHTGRWLLDGSGPIAAVMEKEVRTILRAVNLLYGLGAPLLFVFIFAGLFKSKDAGTSSLPWGYFFCLAYAVVGFTQLIYNNLGTEGAGIQVLFLSPTPIRTVILAKNLFHGFLLVIDAGLVLLLASLRYGVPKPAALGATVAWVIFAIPVHLALGNLLSVTMPYRLPVGRLGRPKGSQSNTLLSMLAQLCVLAIGAGAIAACSLWLHQLWVAVPIFLILAAIGATVWFQSLGSIERIIYRRRDDLHASMVRTD